MPALDGVKILCLGDVMLDRFVVGDVSRISPEAPVPVFRLQRADAILGGVGNVVANLRALGVTASVVGRVGSDAAGKAVREHLRRMGAKSHLLVSRQVPTIRKTRFVAKGSHVLRLDEERVAPLTAAEEVAVCARLPHLLKGVGIVILSDYAKGFLSADLTQKVISICRAADVRVFVDPKGRDYGKYAGATLVKPNRMELEQVAGQSFDPAAADFVECVEAAAKRLARTLAVEGILVTLSEKGMLYVPRNGTRIYLPTDVREVCDVSGAGDTTVAVLAAFSAAGLPMAEAMKAANVAAGIVVGKVGTATVSSDELEDALGCKDDALATVTRKVLSRTALARQVRSWQKAGLRVGFTNGCFDCLHCGHLSSLYQAKEHCDRLVVAVNTDASVRKLKGPTRPIQDEKTRSLVLAGLELVDAVTLFGEATALPLVKAIVPDVIAKEGYTLSKWPEARFVKARGGEVVCLTRVEGYSTSGLVSRMKG